VRGGLGVPFSLARGGDSSPLAHGALRVPMRSSSQHAFRRIAFFISRLTRGLNFYPLLRCRFGQGVRPPCHQYFYCACFFLFSGMRLCLDDGGAGTRDQFGLFLLFRIRPCPECFSFLPCYLKASYIRALRRFSLPPLSAGSRWGLLFLLFLRKDPRPGRTSP